MNRETFAIGMTEYAGVALLLLTALLVGAFDLTRSCLAEAGLQRATRRNASARADG